MPGSPLDHLTAAMHFDHACALQNQGQWEAALAAYERAIALQPDHAEAFLNRGVLFKVLGRFEDALASCNAAILLKHDFAAAYCNRGDLLCEAASWHEALASLDVAIALAPDLAVAHSNRGNVLRRLGRPEEALASCDRALALDPECAAAHSNRGNVMREQRRSAEALASYDRAVALYPEFAEAHSNRALVLKDLAQLDAALAACDRALAINGKLAAAYRNRAAILLEMQRQAAAIADLDQALALDARSPNAFSARLHAQMAIADWRGLEARLALLATRVERDRIVENPFYVLTLVDSGGLQRRAAETWAREEFAEQVGLGPIVGRAAGGRIRVGYFSADFRDHATMHLMAGLLELHDRERFEVTGFSFGPVVQDAVRARVESAFERFVEVGHRSDREVAGLSRELSIDIAVDLKGYTSDARPGIFAHRAAPVQVGYLGYPGTLGAGYVDYLIADRMVVPEGSEGYYREQLVYLPDSYQVNDAKRRIGARRYERGELGLPRAGFVYCCFNNNYKIMPATFGSWMRILGRVPGSVLWLLEDNAQAAQNLRAAAAGHGVPAERLVFAPRVVAGEHLARHGCADLFLDTLPCNAHTTASDALWAGLPVLTCVGEGFAARVAGSLVSAVGLPELIVQSMADYEELAVRLAGDAERLGALRARLERNRGTAPLFDTLRHARHLESAYTLIHARHLAGLPPASLEVP
jgi:predicted O-linked N-acetylglucosamine transferase (SPINDLY family)